jgi:signal transduction histidine kinase
MRRTDRLDFVNTVAMRSSHELKNCLVSIKTFAQLLPERYADKQFREDFYLVVNKEVDRLNRVVENLLFFAQPLKLDHTSCSIDDIIQDTLDELEKEEMLEGINVQRDFKHGSSLVNIDRESMGLVLRHLIYNSIQAMPKGGEIKISTNSNDTEAGHAFEIKISDQGVGIPENVHGKIWEPFFTTKTRGIGLGLTIVRKIIEAHNGTIAIISHVNSQGTEVTVRLPQDQKKYNSARAYFPSGRTVIV